MDVDKQQGEKENFIDVETNNQHGPVPGLARMKSRDEEMASELTADDNNERRMITNEEVTVPGMQMNSIIGWAGLALAILSFFMLPIIFGGAGIIVGIIARGRDVKWLGNIAIAIGVISILITLFILPFI